jgi:3-phosphoshikimate 1-carboxyvinyltransferase
VADIFEVQPCDGFEASLIPPGDKSISHRVLLLGAIANGISHFEGVSSGFDVACTRRAVEALGATVSGATGPGETLVVQGVAESPRLTLGQVECGNSGTSMRLLAGLLVGQGVEAVLTGDESLSRRPMDRVVVPLTEMGASLSGEGEQHLAPLRLRSSKLHSGDLSVIPQVASAQVKGAILLAALGVDGVTKVVESTPTRPHTEELLPSFGCAVEVGVEGANNYVSLRGKQKLHAADLAVPVDPSQVAFMAVAAAICPGSVARFQNVYFGSGRGEVFEVLREIGARVDIREGAQPGVGDIEVAAGELLPVSLAGGRIASLIDELPILAVAMACADGVSEVRQATELRVKESDRISSIVRMMQSFGVPVREFDDGFQIDGRGGRRLIGGGTIHANGDHRIAMSAAIAGLRADRGTTITGWAAVATSYVTFDHDLAQCR